jgi:hypothetical protein
LHLDITGELINLMAIRDLSPVETRKFLLMATGLETDELGVVPI